MILHDDRRELVPVTIHREPADRLPRLSPMARRVAANKRDEVRLVDERPSAGVRPEGVDR